MEERVPVHAVGQTKVVHNHTEENFPQRFISSVMDGNVHTTPSQNAFPVYRIREIAVHCNMTIRYLSKRLSVRDVEGIGRA